MPFSRKSSTGGLVRSAKDTEEELTAKFSAATAKAAQAAQQALRQGDAQKEETKRLSDAAGRSSARLNKARQIASLSAALHEECKWEEAEEKKRDEAIRAAARQLTDCPNPNRRSPPHSTSRPTGRRSNNQGSPGRGPTGRHPTRKQQQQHSTGRFTGRRNDNQGSPGRGPTGRHPTREQHYSTGRIDRRYNRQEATGHSDRQRRSPPAVASYGVRTPGRSVLVSSSSSNSTAPPTRTNLDNPPWSRRPTNEQPPQFKFSNPSTIFDRLLKQLAITEPPSASEAVPTNLQPSDNIIGWVHQN